jgi:DUF4097 and DUF4098 domain-containing protein YvlB
MTTYDIPGRLRLKLKLPAGQIELNTHEQPVAEVEVEPIGRDSASVEAAENVSQELRERGGGDYELTVESSGRRGGLAFWRDAALRFTITVPRGTHVEVETASADIDAQGGYGKVRAATASGEITFGEIEGDATIKSVSGDVEIGSLAGRAECKTVSGDLLLPRVGGDATLHTVSGDMHLGEAGGSVKSKSVSGDLRLDSVRRGDLRLMSVSGDMRIGIAQGVRLWMDVTSVSGKMVSELDASDGGGASPEVELRIEARSTSGDIRLTRSVGVPS